MTTFEDRARAIFEDELRLGRHAASRIDWTTFWDDTHDDDDWLIEPLIAKGRGHSLYAPAKAGKSLFLLDVAARLATGQKVLERRPGDPRHVLYLDMEMTPDDVRERLLDMGYGPAVDMSHLHYHSLPSLSPLDTPIGGAEVAELAVAYEAELVVVDTLSRVLSGPENDADTMSAFFTYTGRPLKALGIAVARLDHTGKDPAKGQRGSSAKSNDVDVVWELNRRDDGHFDLRATHKRMGWVPEEIHLTLHDNPLRHDLVAGSWPTGTSACAEHIDALGLSLDCSSRKAQAALKEAGDNTRRIVVVAALRWRRDQAVDPSDLIGEQP